MAICAGPRQEHFARELAIDRNARRAAEQSGFVLNLCHSLKRFYVYLLIDSRNNEVFYVGKGKDRRAHVHLQEWKGQKVWNAGKFERIDAIMKSGGAVRAVCFVDGLAEGDALDTERWLIGQIGIKNLTNLSPGEQSDLTRAGLQAQLELKKTRPFCRWKNRILHQLDESITPENWEALYWDILGDYSYIVALSQGRPARQFKPMYPYQKAA